MTKRAVFNTAAKHLLTQNCKALSEFNICRYQGENGTKCAVGVCIPNELYHRDLEGNILMIPATLESEFPGNRKAIALAKLIKKHEPLLRQLQLIHDKLLPEEWRTALDKLAKEEKIIRPEY